MDSGEIFPWAIADARQRPADRRADAVLAARRAAARGNRLQPVAGLPGPRPGRGGAALRARASPSTSWACVRDRGRHRSPQPAVLPPGRTPGLPARGPAAQALAGQRRRSATPPSTACSREEFVRQPAPTPANGAMSMALAPRAASPAAVAALRRGEVIGLPTETVYGLAADASQRRRRAPDLRAQGPACGPSADRARRRRRRSWTRWSRDPRRGDARWRDAFWPGPLTLILPRAARACRTSSPAARTPSDCAARRIRWRWRCCASSAAAWRRRRPTASAGSARPRPRTCARNSAPACRWCSTAATATSASKARSST